jgi:hypothetical protein
VAVNRDYFKTLARSYGFSNNDLWDAYDSQAGRCALSGVRLTQDLSSIDLITLDRNYHELRFVTAGIYKLIISGYSDDDICKFLGDIKHDLNTAMVRNNRDKLVIYIEHVLDCAGIRGLTLCDIYIPNTSSKFGIHCKGLKIYVETGDIYVRDSNNRKKKKQSGTAYPITRASSSHSFARSNSYNSIGEIVEPVVLQIPLADPACFDKVVDFVKNYGVEAVQR